MEFPHKNKSDLLIGPCQVLPFRVNLRVMAIKGYSTFPKAPASDCLMSYPGHLL